jgi:hypothetical protein
MFGHTVLGTNMSPPTADMIQSWKHVKLQITVSNKMQYSLV